MTRLQIQTQIQTTITLGLMLILGACEAQKRQPTRTTPRPVAPPSQVSASEPKLPKDPAVRHGVLANGMTYYIRKNSKPENRAELRLLVNAGSLLEEDDQQGIAHFLEHMAFNGTENFAKKELVDYLQSIGMKFGAHVNAMTSFEETVYLLRVPTEDDSITNKALQILEDWARAISLDPEEIEAERGVVIEEWRLSLGAQNRVTMEQIPILFKDGRHAQRLPIGKKEILENAPPAAFKRFYDRWYRPDLMAVVAVGDFDPQVMEQKIKNQFEDLQKPKAPANRPDFHIPDHKETFFAAITDPELTESEIIIYYKHDPKPSGTESAYRASLVSNLAETMLNRRLSERAREANPPFIYAYTGESGMARTKRLIVQAASIKGDAFEEGLRALLEGSRQVALHGFTPTELEREKAEMLRGMTKAFEERDKTHSAVYAGEYQRNFLNGESFPGIEVEFELYKKFLPTISLEEVNKVADNWFRDENRVIFVTAPEKDSITLPTRDAVYAIIADVNQKDVPAYEDRALDQELFNQNPVAGSVVETSTVPQLNITEWRLSNGARVILKPTDFKNDQILFSGSSVGGHSLVSNEDYVPAMTATVIQNASGLGDFDAIQLDKKLQGKRVGVSPFIGTFGEALSGQASVDELEILFQLIHLQFTAPRFSETAFQSIQTRWKALVENRLSNPNAVFQNAITQELFGDHPRHQPMSAELLEKMNLAQSEAIYKDRFADASDFTFYFVGNVSPAQLKPLVENYLASLPNLGRNETWRNPGDVIKPGKKEVTVRKGLEPKASVRLLFHGDAEWNSDNRLHLGALNDIIKLRLYDTLREEKGGTYGVAVSGSLEKEPQPAYMNRITFGCSPENVEELVQATLDELDRIAKEGVEDSYLIKMRETLLRTYEENQTNNSFWLGNLQFLYDNNIDPLRLLDYEERVKGITNDHIRQAAKVFYNPDQYLKAVLLPETSE